MTALMTQAETYLLQNDFDRAALLVKHAKAHEPASIEPDVMMGRIALHLEKLDDARTILDGVIVRAPKHGYARMLLGLVHEAKGQHDAALLHFEQATRFAPALMPAWFNQARLMLKKARLVEAAIAFERAAELAPDNVAVLAAWAQTLAKLGHARRAANTYLRCIEQNVANPFFVTELADLLVTAGEHGLADEVLEAGSKVFPSQGLFESKRGALAIQRKDLGTALKHAREAVRRQPDCAEFLLSLAAIETARLHLDEARAAAEKALALDPKSWKALHQLGIVFEAVKQKEKAISFYRRAVEQAPTEWAPRNNLAVLLLEAGSARDVKEATALLEVESGRASATVQLNLALAHLKAGQKTLARQFAATASRLGVAGNEIATEAGLLATALR
ncbi:MAG: tetratricopeptide repeat protein [Myxococcaceae bacterium]|nr:tetratricopeptide repeat protein [Myxococcaceae bacterium]